MRYLPIFIDIDAQPCLVVGGGNVALRKILLLIDAGATVTVIAPHLCTSLERLHNEGKIHYMREIFNESHLTNFRLVFATTNDSKVNQYIAKLAKEKNIPANVADKSTNGNFIVPSIVDRAPVTVAVSSGGSSPVLARLLRTRLESLIPSKYGELAILVEQFRQQVKKSLKPELRRRFWDKVLQGPIAEMVFSGNMSMAKNALQESLKDPKVDGKSGEVYLVGAGPGDPDLLTFRAQRLLQQADVVLYDRLVSEPVLSMVRKGAERIYVGKRRSHHAVPQDQINSLLLALAREGKRVLRLKGGDPFIFGRGGEEIEDLMQEGIPFQVVPGITAASGCSSYSGIPLTHRDYSQSCLFVTGHLKSGSVDLNWTSLCQPNQTVVVYMGLTGLPVLCEKMIEHGTSPDMPAALIEQGTTPNQRVLVGTLKTLPAIVESKELKAPTLIIVGEVVKLRDQLNWYQHES